MSISNLEPIYPSRRITILALIVALGVVLHRFEALIPLPSPWIKLGLANVMTLVTLVFLGFRDALIVTLLRITLGSILWGTFLSPGFFLSLFGGIAATFTMAMVYYYRKNPFSLIGISICAAYAHTIAAILCVYLFWVRNEIFFKLLPVFFTFALITGILNGIVSNYVTKKLTEGKIAFT